MSTAEITDGHHLAGFVEAFGKMEGKALAAQIATVLSHPSLFVFGELLVLSNVKKLAESADTKTAFDQLEMFAYGTFDQYQARTDLPKLSERQERKLKQLTIVTLASKNRALAYDQLSSTLAIQTVRELEDLIIESVYLGLVSGKLNQAKKVFEVAEVSGRDVRASDIAQMLDILTTWQSTSATVMENIHKRIVAADDDNKVAAIKKTSREASIQDKFQTVRIALESDPDGRKGNAGFDDTLAALGLTGMGGQGRKTKGHRPGRNG